MMDISTLPLPLSKPIMECIATASRNYQVPRILVISIIKTESNGNPAAINRNRNGTTDNGLMQINTVWHQRLERHYGIANASYHIKHNVCYNINVGTWILSNEIASAVRAGKTLWDGVGNYHSRTARFNVSYQKQVAKNMLWLSRNTNWAGY